MVECGLCKDVILPLELLVATCCCECGAFIHQDCNTKQWLESGSNRCPECSSDLSALPGFIRTEKLFSLSGNCCHLIAALLEFSRTWDLSSKLSQSINDCILLAGDDIAFFSELVASIMRESFFGKKALLLAAEFDYSNPFQGYITEFVNHLLSNRGLSMVGIYICKDAINKHRSRLAFDVIDSKSKTDPNWPETRNKIIAHVTR